MTVSSPPLVAIRYPSWSRYWMTVVPGLLEHIKDRTSWRLVSDDNAYGEQEALTIDHRWRGDGAVLFRSTEKELKEFRRRGMAVVLTSTEGPDGGYPRVVPDNVAVGRLAAEHFLEKGVQEFAYLARGETVYQEEVFAPGKRVYSLERFRGYQQRLSQEGLLVKSCFLRGSPLWEKNAWREIQQEVEEFIRSLPDRCGLFVVDDSLAAVALKAAHKLKREVPNQLLVLSFGDDPMWCYANHPTLSSIPYPGHAVGRAVADLLEKQFRGEPCRDLVIRVPTDGVIQRTSSEGLAIDDDLIRDLVAWMHQHVVHQVVAVPDLESRTGLSASTLNLRFKNALGMSPKKLISQIRLQRLKHLLLRSDMTLSQISESMAFASAHEMSRFFYKELNCRPSTWREGLGAENNEAGVSGAAMAVENEPE